MCFLSFNNSANIFENISIPLQASQRNHQMQELTRFLHHYSRYSSHRALLEAEVLLLHSVTDKMNTLSTALQGQYNKTGKHQSLIGDCTFCPLVRVCLDNLEVRV